MLSCLNWRCAKGLRLTFGKIFNRPPFDYSDEDQFISKWVQSSDWLSCATEQVKLEWFCSPALSLCGYSSASEIEARVTGARRKIRAEELGLPLTDSELVADIP